MSNGIVKWLKDKSNNIVVPNTLTKCVYNENGNNIEDVMIIGDDSIDFENIEINDLHRYSTEEQIVGYWIDETPIYEKTVIFNGGKFMGSINNLLIADNINEIINHNTIMTIETSVTSPKSYYPLPYSHSTESYNIGMFFNDDKSMSLRMGTSYGSGLYGTQIRIIAQYTKTNN